jgi:hypothetical protein
LVDVDVLDESLWEVLPAALAMDEPQLALRRGRVHVPRLARLNASVSASEHRSEGLGSDGTVLVTGGTDALGALVARHLVTAHGCVTSS